MGKNLDQQYLVIFLVINNGVMMPSTILRWSKCSYSEILFLSIIFGDEWISQPCFVPDSTADENGWSDGTKVAE